MSINVWRRDEEINRRTDEFNRIIQPLHEAGYDLMGTFKRKFALYGDRESPDDKFNFNLTLFHKFESPPEDKEDEKEEGAFYIDEFSYSFYVLLKSIHKQPKRFGIVYHNHLGCLGIDFSIYGKDHMIHLFKDVLSRKTHLCWKDRIHISFTEGV